MALKSSIDLGTNTCLLLIAEGGPASAGSSVGTGGSEFEVARVHEDLATIVRLGEGVDRHRELQPAAMERTLECLRRYADRVRGAGLAPRDTVAVATSQARDARNGADFFVRVERETGFRFRVLSGDDEAKLSFRGALLPGMDVASTVVIDIGGGSTELISAIGGQSIDVGSVRFTERYLHSDPVTDEEFWKCQDAVDAALEPLLAWREKLPGQPRLVGVAGTVTALAARHLALPEFDVRRIDESLLTRGDIHRMVEELKWRTRDERRVLPGMEPKRADVLLAGALILWRAMERLRFAECVVSTRGLRFGALGLN